MNPAPQTKQGPTKVLIVDDTYVKGMSVRTGAVVVLQPDDLALLREGRRCVNFDAENSEHVAAEEAYKKALATSAKK